MLDFLSFKEELKKDRLIIKPKYDTFRSKDIMIRGGDFYAIYDEDTKMWHKDFFKAIEIIDRCIRKYSEGKKSDYYTVVPLYLREADNRSIDNFKHFCQKQMADTFHELDESIIFADKELCRDDYATKKLDYVLEDVNTPAYDELIGTLYSPEERMKFEWAIGSIINGDSKRIQKFVIFVGDAGTGKSTVMNIIRLLFDGYYGTFDAKALGNPNSSFALEPLRYNPLVAIQDDADLSRIEDNTRLNSLISHEPLVINEKRKTQYEMKFRTFIFLGSNKEVKITDARSGLLRRIIDIAPTGKKVTANRYYELIERIKFELGGIAYKCLKVYESNKRMYDGYFPVRMIRATNHFYDFIEENWFDLIKDHDYVDLKDAWNTYKMYCDMSSVAYPYSMQTFKNEFKNYFKEFIPDGKDKDGNHIRSRFVGFKYEKLGMIRQEEEPDSKEWLEFKDVKETSVFDILCGSLPAQYAGPNGTPSKVWSEVTKKLKDIDPTKLHYTKVFDYILMVDFDKKDPVTGEKSFELNYEAAKLWPPTYAELSKSGAGIHLIYIYDGDPEEVAKLYDEDIELKFFKGGASMRRLLTKYCNLPIATINSGLPKKEKGENNMVDEFVLKNEKAIRTMIEKNLRKEYHPGTKPSVDYIYKILEDANDAGVQYDVTDMRPRVLAFANGSTHQSEYCVKLVNKMRFCSDIDTGNMLIRNIPNAEWEEDDPIAFFDVEVFPNLFILVYKHPDEPCVRMINPTSDEVKSIMRFKLIGFNCRRYDNHILYARIQGYSNEQLFNLSQRIISDSKNCMFSGAYNLSYTDVYDFSSAGNRKSLKKWEIELGINHVENQLPWDKPVDPKLWEQVADYCCNDVISTEIVFNHLKSDWTARQILADLSGLSVNDTTNQHTTKIIFGNDKHPQSEFMYRDLSKPVTWLPPAVSDFLWNRFPEMMDWWRKNTDSLLPYFPGYSFDHGKSVYKGVEVGEGGYVEAQPGMYGYTGLLDVASMHPHSALSECLFGLYTQNFADLVDGRILIKHEDWEHVNDILGGKLAPYVEKVKNGEMTSKDLANALKTAINSVYGLTSASFDNPFHDIRNKDNIVAKRGALFMVDLAEAVKAKGYTVAHIKTDSIKIPDIDQNMVDFVMEFGKRYGYSFEWEATYDKICLVNDAVYIARYRNDDGSVGKWTATGAQFAEPYIFKTMFSHEPVTIEDYAQTKSVSSSLYLDMNENLGEDEHNYIFVGKVGSFLPVRKGSGGGQLVREKDGKYYAVAGTKGFRWLETEIVKNLNMEDQIDMTYFVKMADAAVAKIEEFGSFEWLVDPAPYNSTVPYGTMPGDDFMNLPEPSDDEVPWKVA